ncbi:MAG: hypothetical protein ACK5LX_16495 [Oscillospiraceae bacterium]
MKENKTYARTVRMKESIRIYVEKHPGENFSDKFEKMVLYSMQKEAQINYPAASSGVLGDGLTHALLE